jgi:hypothetical protein
MTNNSSHSALRIGYREKCIEEMINTRFLGLQSDNHLNWKKQTEQMIPKLCKACYAIRSMVYNSTIIILKQIYNAYVHAIIKYAIIFWGNSSNSGKIFTLQKKIVRIMAYAQPKISGRSLLQQLEILPVPCQYIL